MIDATEVNQQLKRVASYMKSEESFLKLTKQAFADAKVDPEFELKQGRIAPYFVDVNKPLVETEPLISIGGMPVCSAGNISTIVGEAKSKKTFLTTAIVASAIAYPFPDSRAFDNVSNNISLKVLWLDTEQSEAHVRKVIDRINRMSGNDRSCRADDPRLGFYALREIEPSMRLDVLRDALYVSKPNIVVIDGVADMQYDTNDLRESDALVGELMALSTVYNCHIICVLHTNPGTDKARGHVGSSLQRKSESVIYVHKVGNTSIVEPQFCRNEPFERFAFQISEEGLPEICNLPTEPQTKEDEVVEVLRSYFGGSVERKVLAAKLSEVFNIQIKAAGMRIHRARRKGVITIDECNVVQVA